MVPEKLSRPWLLLGVRLTVFPIEPWTVSADLWEQVVGAPPETDQNQPRLRVRVQTGPWHEGVLQLTISPHTIVWVTAPAVGQAGLANVDDLRVVDVVPDFLATTRSWLSSEDFDVKRVGFGLHTLLSAQDRASSYRILQSLVSSVTIEPETTSDLLYQINRPVPSRVLGAEVRLNRLMKWSGLFIGRAQFEAGHTQIAQAGPVLGSYYASLDNDINTPAEHLGPFEKGQLGAIYDELVELGWENLEAGEKA
jgi:hypothetical protein